MSNQVTGEHKWLNRPTSIAPCRKMISMMMKASPTHTPAARSDIMLMNEICIDIRWYCKAMCVSTENGCGWPSYLFEWIGESSQHTSDGLSRDLIHAIYYYTRFTWARDTYHQITPRSKTIGMFSSVKPRVCVTRSLIPIQPGRWRAALRHLCKHIDAVRKQISSPKIVLGRKGKQNTYFVTVTENPERRCWTADVEEIGGKLRLSPYCCCSPSATLLMTRRQT